MAYNPPFEYSISPERIEPGTHWVSIHLKNIERQPMMNMNVRLISNDPLRIQPLDRGGYINLLNPCEERVVPVQIEANQGSWVYLHIEYWLDDEMFYWESPNVWLKVRRDPARIMTLFSIKGHQLNLGEEIPVEATVTADLPVDDLHIDFWIETADGKFETFQSIDIDHMDAGEVRTITSSFTPEEEGLYSIYAYLFDEKRRVDRKIEQLRITES
jgi:hypothetical protein